MTNGVSEVDEIAETCLALIDGDNVGLDRDGADDYRQEEFLCGRASRLLTTGEVLRGRLDSSKDLRGVGLKCGEFCFIPNGSGLHSRLEAKRRQE